MIGEQGLGRSRFYRLGSAMYRRRRWVLLAWLLVLVALGPALGKLSTNLSQGGFAVPGSQSDRVARAVEEDFSGNYEITDLLVMKSETLVATDPAFRAAFGKVRAALSDAPGVDAITDPYASPERSISPDGHVLTATIGITDDQSQALIHNPELEAAVENAAEGTQIQALLTGAPPFYAAFTETTTHDLERAEKIALPITLIILVFAFGSVVAAGVPLVLALLGLAVSFGLISLLATQVTVSTFAQNTASMIGIGVGIDYSLFVLTRFREYLRAGSEVPAAVAEAMATSGKAVFVSALTVVVALAGTLLVNIAAFKSMGFSAMIAVGLAGAAALTLLPAILGMFGHRINKWAIGRRRASGGAWHRWATAVMARPWLALFVAVGILAVLAVPALGLRMGSSGPSILPPDAGPRVAAEITADAFGEGQVAPVQIVVDDRRGVFGRGFDDLYTLVGRLAKDPEVARIDSLATLRPGSSASEAKAIARAARTSPFVAQLVDPTRTSTLVLVVTKHGPQSDPVDAYVERLRGGLPTLLAPGVSAIVGGDAGLNTDINDEMARKLVPIVALVLLLSFLVLMVFFRSILLPLKAILMNTASVLATYGVLVFIFQDGHFENLLGFESTGNIDSFLPLFLFSILFGLSMDYEVFMLARIREEYLRTGDNTEAVGWGLEHTGRIITSAALIMVTVFGAFAFASLAPIKAMGFGLATAVFLDATLIRSVLVPATMRLMGDWNWWMPKWLDRIVPRVALEEATAEPVPVS